jgi:hypothetical protein
MDRTGHSHMGSAEMKYKQNLSGASRRTGQER